MDISGFDARDTNGLACTTWKGKVLPWGAYKNGQMRLYAGPGTRERGPAILTERLSLRSETGRKLRIKETERMKRSEPVGRFIVFFFGPPIFPPSTDAYLSIMFDRPDYTDYKISCVTNRAKWISNPLSTTLIGWIPTKYADVQIVLSNGNLDYSDMSHFISCLDRRLYSVLDSKVSIVS